MLEHDKDELAALRETVKNLSDLVLEHLVKPEVEEETTNSCRTVPP